PPPAGNTGVGLFLRFPLRAAAALALALPRGRAAGRLGPLASLRRGLLLASAVVAIVGVAGRCLPVVVVVVVVGRGDGVGAKVLVPVDVEELLQEDGVLVDLAVGDVVQLGVVKDEVELLLEELGGVAALVDV